MMKLHLYVSLVVSILLFQVLAFEAVAQVSAPPPQVSAVVDTALVEIILPEGAPDCLSVVVSPETLGFGMAGSLELEFGQSLPVPMAEELKSSASWLKLNLKKDATQANKIAFDIHAYRLNPFRIKVGPVVGPVISIKGAVSDVSQTAAIRMPRNWDTRWWILVLISLALTFIIMLLWWLWRRRVRLQPLNHWELKSPAWLQASINLRKLLEDGYPDLNTSRQFLDQLAMICRAYLAGRYLVHAGEMTSGEILTSCQLKGHDSRPLRSMVKILQNLDHNRYDPDPPSVSWCRAQAGALLDAIDEVRILPRYTLVEAALLLEGEKAWSWLNQLENRLPDSVSVSGEGK